MNLPLSVLLAVSATLTVGTSAVAEPAPWTAQIRPVDQPTLICAPTLDTVCHQAARYWNQLLPFPLQLTVRTEPLLPEIPDGLPLRDPGQWDIRVVPVADWPTPTGGYATGAGDARCRIVIRGGYDDTPWTLIHEIGHCLGLSHDAAGHVDLPDYHGAMTYESQFDPVPADDARYLHHVGYPVRTVG